MEEKTINYLNPVKILIFATIGSLIGFALSLFIFITFVPFLEWSVIIITPLFTYLFCKKFVSKSSQAVIISIFSSLGICISGFIALVSMAAPVPYPLNYFFYDLLFHWVNPWIGLITFVFLSTFATTWIGINIAIPVGFRLPRKPIDYLLWIFVLIGSLFFILSVYTIVYTIVMGGSVEHELQSIKKAAVGGNTPYLIEQLNNPSNIYAVIDAFKTLGPKGKDAVPDLIKFLRNNDQNLRYAAAMSLGYIGPDASESTPELIEVLKNYKFSGGNDDGEAASFALGRMGKNSVPYLIKVITDEKENNYYSYSLIGVIRALGDIRPDATESIPYLIEFIKLNYNLPVKSPGRYSRGDVIQTAQEALGKMGKAVVPFLIGILEEENINNNNNSSSYAVEILKSIGPEAKESIPSLLKYLKKQPYNENIAYVIHAIDPTIKDEIVPVLVKNLIPNRYKKDIEMIVKTLVEIGTPEAIKAVNEFKAKNPQIKINNF